MAGAHHSCSAPSDSTGSVDTRDSSQKTFWPNWDSVSTLAQVVSTLEAFPEHLLAVLGQCVDTSSSSVDTSALPEQNL
ncbi:hypothetical protein Taro_001826 [Colocasia esculenta]|uniref:Uncharacterized protein n=1 Tax=Colocasia esculenta TaxID=4460 RepID=A0A843TJZ2_COLES|nr:hypothetical protein [Colocasia esculenta]